MRRLQSVMVNGVAVFFDLTERDAAEIIRAICARCLPLIETSWGLALTATLILWNLGRTRRYVLVLSYSDVIVILGFLTMVTGFRPFAVAGQILIVLALVLFATLTVMVSDQVMKNAYM